MPVACAYLCSDAHAIRPTCEVDACRSSRLQLAVWLYSPPNVISTYLEVISDVQDAQALFMSDMSTSAVADKVLALQNAAGIKAPLVNPRGSGVKAITLTGWGALAALTALITLIVGGSYFAYKKYVSPDPSYVMVSKSGDV